VGTGPRIGRFRGGCRLDGGLQRFKWGALGCFDRLPRPPPFRPPGTVRTVAGTVGPCWPPMFAHMRTLSERGERRTSGPFVRRDRRLGSLVRTVRDPQCRPSGRFRDRPGSSCAALSPD